MKFSVIAKISLLLSSVFLSSLVLGDKPALADVSVSPLVIETEAKRGQTQGTIAVSNQELDPFRARVYTAPFTYDPEKGFQLLSSSPNDLSPYLQFSPKELVVPGSDNRRIRFIATFPPSLPDGEYRAMIFTEKLKPATVTQSNQDTGVTLNTNIVTRIGVAVYIRKGNISPNLKIDTARYNNQTNKTEMLVRNSGKASAIVNGNWILKQGANVINKGNLIDTTVIAEQDRYVVTDNFTANQPQLDPGTYQLSGDLRWGQNGKNIIPFNFNVTVPQK